MHYTFLTSMKASHILVNSAITLKSTDQYAVCMLLKIVDNTTQGSVKFLCLLHDNYYVFLEE